MAHGGMLQQALLCGTEQIGCAFEYFMCRLCARLCGCALQLAALLELGQHDLAHIVYRLRYVVGELVDQRRREGTLHRTSSPYKDLV